MFGAIGRSLRWCLSLGAKFVRVTPVATTAVVVTTLISQIAILLAFFLPLKVVILLGSDRIPRYFPDFFADYDRNSLIMWLGLAAGGFYLLHLLSEQVIRWFSDRGTASLLAQSRKLVLFENQSEMAAAAYQRYSSALAGVVFATLSITALGFVYPALALVLGSFGIGTLLLSAAAWRYSTHARDLLGNRLNTFVRTASAVGFMFAFAYLVLDFLLGSPPGLIVAIISLLLSRQALIRLAGSITHIGALYRRRGRLDVLFFHGKVLAVEQKTANKGLLALFQPEVRVGWVSKLLEEHLDTGSRLEGCSWYELGFRGTAALRVTAAAPSTELLVKVFETSRTALALHEATLLAEGLDGLPAPRLVGATQVDGSRCHLLDIEGFSPVPRSEVKQAANQVRTEMMGVAVPRSLAGRYRRSHPMLWQKLDLQTATWLAIAANDDAAAGMVAQYRDRLGEISEVLQSLPLAIANRDLTVGSMLQSRDGRRRAVHWGRWTIEPLGAGWPVGGQLKQLGGALASAGSIRPELIDVDPAKAELAAVAFALERACGRQRLALAIELLQRLLKLLDAISAAGPSAGIPLAESPDLVQAYRAERR